MAKNQDAPAGTGAGAAKRAGRRDNAQLLNNQFTPKTPSKATRVVKVLADVFGRRR